jgi:RHS repeat-associated protein
LIDEVRVSNAAVYSSNFTPQTHLTAGANTKGLWKFDGQSSNDASSNGNNGTLQGGAGYSDDVPSGDGGGGSGGGTPAQTLWLVSDHLGTPRMIFDQTGTLANMKRHDYLPFGEELFAGTGGRTTAMGYSGGDGVRQQFTAKERDVETGFDYFLARYYSSIQGRFTSPDEFTGGPDELYSFASDASNNPTFYADLKNPQSLNKYQYAYGNPLRFVDPDGHDPEPAPDPQDPCGCQLTLKQLAELKRDLEKLDEATSKPLYPITDTIGTSTPPTIGPITLPKDETVAPVPRVQPYEMARPIDDPDKKGHRKKHRKDHDKHTKPRPGDKQPPNYRPFRRPPPKPKPERKKPKPRREPTPEIGPDGLPVKP